MTCSRSKWIPGFARRFLPEKIRQPVSGATRVVWCAALDFPSILLDRVIGTFAYASQRPHARRDRVTLSAAQLKLILNAQHASSEQVIDHAWQKIFTAIRAGKMTPAQRTDLRNKIRKWLEKISTLQIDFTAAEG